MDHLTYRRVAAALVFSQSTEEEVETNVEIPNAQHEVIKKSIRGEERRRDRDRERKEGTREGGRERNFGHLRWRQ